MFVCFASGSVVWFGCSAQSYDVVVPFHWFGLWWSNLAAVGKVATLAGLKQCSGCMVYSSHRKDRSRVLTEQLGKRLD